MFQDKAQTAENGMSFSRAATQYWDIWVPPFGRAGKRSVPCVRLLGKGMPLPDSRLSCKQVPDHSRVRSLLKIKVKR